MPDDLGKLRHRVELQTRGDSPNAGTGGLDETYSTVATVWAHVESISGARYLASQQVEDVITHSVTTRYRSDYETLKYIHWGTRRFRIKTVRALDAENRFHEFLCEEVKSGV